jgi:hypothetical protein
VTALPNTELLSKQISSSSAFHNDDFQREESFAKFSSSAVKGPLAIAFQKARLNPADPMDWYKLTSLFAWAHFGDRKGKGAPKKWTSMRYCKLIVDLAAISYRNPALLDEEKYRLLGKRTEYQTKRGPLSPSRLRKLRKKAFNPKTNELLVALTMGHVFKDLDGTPADPPPPASGSES